MTSSHSRTRPRQLVFSLPMPLNIANARLHWRAKNRERRAYLDTLMLLQMAKHLPQSPRSPFAHPRIAVVMTLANRMDHDNAMARLKWPCDWLQASGFIANDKDLTWDGLPTQVISRSIPARIEITLTETTP